MCMVMLVHQIYIINDIKLQLPVTKLPLRCLNPSSKKLNESVLLPAAAKILPYTALRNLSMLLHRESSLKHRHALLNSM